MRGSTRRIPCGHQNCLFEVALYDSDQASIVLRQVVARVRERVDEPAERRIDELLVRESAQRRALAATRSRAACRHVGRLVPGQERGRRLEIADLDEAPLELLEPLVDRAAIVSPAGGGPGSGRPPRCGCTPARRGVAALPVLAVLAVLGHARMLGFIWCSPQHGVMAGY